MTISQQREQNLILKYLPYLIALLLLAIAAWYFTRPQPPSVQLTKVRVTTDSKHKLPIAPNLLNRQFDQSTPNKVWVADI